MRGLSVVCVLAVACTASGSAPDSESTPSAESTPDAPPAGLAADFVRWVFPVSAGDYETGAETFLAPFFRRQELELASCLDGRGFRDLAEAIRSDSPAKYASLSEVLFPSPPSLDVSAIEDAFSQQMPARALLSGINFNVGDVADEVSRAEIRRRSVEQLAAMLAGAPHFGIPSVGAGGLYDALVGCAELAPPAVPEFLQYATSLTSDWLESLAEIEADEAVIDALDSATRCLTEVAPEFAVAENIAHWRGIWDSIASATAPSDHARWTTLRAWLEDYYACMEPVIEVRRPLRLAALEATVDGSIAQLLQLEADIRDALEDLET